MIDVPVIVYEAAKDGLEDYVDDSDEFLVREISSKIAGDPRLDGLDISERSSKSIAKIVAESTHRVNLAEFGIDRQRKAREDIVELSYETMKQLSDTDQNEGSETDDEDSATDSDASAIEDHDDITVADEGMMSTAFDDYETSSKDEGRDVGGSILGEGK